MFREFIFANLVLIATVFLGFAALRYFKPRSKGSPLAAGGKAFAFQVSESRFVDFDGSVFDFSTGVHSAFEPRSKGLPLAAGGIALCSCRAVDLDGSRSAAVDLEPRSKGSPLAAGGRP